MRTIHVGLAGFGTVGGGTFAVLRENAELIAARCGARIEVSCAVVRDIEKARAKAGPELKLSTDFATLLDDPDIDIVVEVMGGIEPAKSLILGAIERGKDVVTANKHLIAKYGETIFEAAARKGVTVAYEASVAGGIPIIKALREGLAANRITSVAGIVNGTSNFILTTMREQKADFQSVLEQAQKLGYAEADPTFDIEGIDAAHKMTILASLAFGTPLNFQAAQIEGITAVEACDIALAEDLGYRIKLVGLARQVESGIELSVRPRLVPKSAMLAHVEGVVNAVQITGTGIGETFYVGRGAGERPTASAVVADLMDLVRTQPAGPAARVPMTGLCPALRRNVGYVKPGSETGCFYVRAASQAARALRERFSKHAIGIEREAERGEHVVFFTAPVVAAVLQQVLQDSGETSRVLAVFEP